MTIESSNGNGGGAPRSWLAISLLISLALVTVNVVAYVIYTRTTAEPTQGELRPDDGGRQAPEQREDVTSLALEQRQRGVEALRNGDYKAARIALETSRTLDPDQSDIDALIEVTDKLAANAPDDASDSDPTPEAPPTPPSEAQARAPVEPAATVRSPSRRTTRPSPSRAARPSRSAESNDPQMGLILVTVEPAGLGVFVDGQPKDLTPARVSVAAGRHVVEVRRGDEVVSRHDVVVTSGGVALIKGSPGPTPTKAEARAVEASRSGLTEDSSLDLVALLDREPAPDARAPAPAPAPTPAPADRWTPTAPGAAPRLVVYRPGKNPSALRATLSRAMPGIDVRVVGRAAELVPGSPADAVLAPPSTVSQSGLTARLTAESNSRYILASFAALPSKATLPSLTIAVVGELDRRAMPERVRGILGVSSAPKLRRVPRTEDLLSSMQLGMAQAILVRAEDYPSLKRRTRQALNEQTFVDNGVGLVVAYVDGGRGETIASALRRLNGTAKQELGVDAWVAR